MSLDIIVKRQGLTSRTGWRVINQIAKEVAIEVGYFWHDNFLQKHFTHAGAREYGYEPRQGERGSGMRFSGSYTQHKLHRFNHTRPLEFTGDSRSLLETSKHKVRATATGGEATLRIPLGAPNFNRFGRGGRYGTSKVDLRHDITAVSEAEIGLMAKEANRLFIEKYNSLRNSQRIGSAA